MIVMPQIKKVYKLLNCKIERDVAEQLEHFSKETGISKTATVEKALKRYFEQYEKTGRV